MSHTLTKTTRVTYIKDMLGFVIEMHHAIINAWNILRNDTPRFVKYSWRIGFSMFNIVALLRLYVNVFFKL